jgi:hypothetical protein
MNFLSFSQVPDQAIRLRFVKQVHVVLLDAAYDELESQLGQLESTSSLLESIGQGSVLHNTSVFVARTLSTWGEDIFFLKLSDATAHADAGVR